LAGICRDRTAKVPSPGFLKFSETREGDRLFPYLRIRKNQGLQPLLPLPFSGHRQEPAHNG